MELIELLYCETYLDGIGRETTREWYISNFPLDRIQYRTSLYHSNPNLKTTLSLIKKKNWALVDKKRAEGIISIIDCKETCVGIEKILEELLK